MTLMKSILLGSAAGIVAVAGAQAADLPTKKAAPAEYVKICNVGGMAGFVLPGSDTCLKISGYITAQVEGGNTKVGYAWAAQGTALVSNGANTRPTIGYTTRFNLTVDARQNTAYGVLRGYAEAQFENGNGFDNTGVGAYINKAYVQWAGITAGKVPSFFSFIGGGEGWANIFSPDMQGFNQPDVLAYTATFGGGFSATLALQSPGANANGPGTNLNINTTRFGMTAPDFVANLRVDQPWGAAQVSGVAHQVHDYATAAGPAGPPGTREDKWGYALNAGVKFNLPTLGAGDNIQAQATWSRNAIWYSGIPDGMWGENGAVNGNGLAMSIGDSYFAGGAAGFATPTAWSATVTMEHYFSPAFSLDPEVSYANLRWSNSGGQLSSNSDSWIAGIVGHWDPVPGLDFELEVLYQTTKQSTPGLYTPVAGTINGVLAPFPSRSDGFAGRFEITRSF